MKQETERGIVIVATDSKQTAQQTPETIGTYGKNWQTPIVNTLNMVHIPELIQTGQQRRRERRKEERKNKRK